MRMHQYLFLLFLLMKPFYWFSSGGLQIADVFFILSFGLYVLFVKKGEKISIEKNDKWLLYFVVCIVAINLFYGVLHGESNFIQASLYYVYNLLVVLTFRAYAEEQDSFLVNVARICKINLVLQLLFYVTGIGRYFAASRYMGTFNDPNQMAFFVYISLMMAFLIYRIRGEKLNWVYHVIAMALIFFTASAGMLMGMVVFYGFESLPKVRMLAQRQHSVRAILIGTAFLAALVLFSPEIGDYISDLSESSIVERAEEKLSRMGESAAGPTNIEERGIDRLYLYPEKLLYGAGEGYQERFDRSYLSGEVHSTLLSMLFYYGILPTAALLYWIWKNIGRLSVSNMAVVLSLFLESLTLLNQRQSLFWMIFVLLSVLYKKQVADKETAVVPATLLSGTQENAARDILLR
ncbi:hypothetical protein [Trichococcus shcherbakoviae]|uniref:O-antigen ligase n=1 Tax=Trichococcus shcherbakoviae subsp. psychrophilus TaxID=2585775 RepID=A0A5C5E6M9_9LACT|nr:hypothetical protein [Trichococcus shcherbakoviae]TNV68407.1 hypothetical protein FHK04_09330 [Trichococcus shcherbakoviae subsp. psychrophilus]